MVHAHVRVLVADDAALAQGVAEPGVREVAPWTDPVITQLLVGRGWRMPLADMLARFDDSIEPTVTVDEVRCELMAEQIRARRLPECR